jgi:hypothetical protein
MDIGNRRECPSEYILTPCAVLVSFRDHDQRAGPVRWTGVGNGALSGFEHSFALGSVRDPRTDGCQGSRPVDWMDVRSRVHRLREQTCAVIVVRVGFGDGEQRTGPVHRMDLFFGHGFGGGKQAFALSLGARELSGPDKHVRACEQIGLRGGEQTVALAGVVAGAPDCRQSPDAGPRSRSAVSVSSRARTLAGGLALATAPSVRAVSKRCAPSNVACVSAASASASTCSRRSRSSLACAIATSRAARKTGPRLAAALSALDRMRGRFLESATAAIATSS